MSEHQNIEWKESWRDEYLKWICGFANATGGKLIIGKSDDGLVIGLSKVTKLMEELPNKIKDTLGIICDVNLLEESGNQSIEILIRAYDVAISYHGKYYYRAGSTNQLLNGEALNEFLLRKSGKTWDNIIEPKASFEDIDERAIEIFKKGAIKSQRLLFVEDTNNHYQLFHNLRICEADKLKRAAVLLFGKDPRKYFTNAFIKIGRFGMSDSDLLSQDVVEGNIIGLADQTMEIIEKKYLKKSITYDGLQRIENLEYPYEAIREVLLNAIVHRLYIGAPIQIRIYDNKIMIWNYGILPGSIKLEDLKQKHASHPRNPVLADVFFKGGLIEAWGRGTLKIIEACKKANLPEPVFEEITGGFSVTLFKDRQTNGLFNALNLNARQIKAVEYLKKHLKISNKDYQKINNCSRNTASNDLNELVDKELLSPSGQKGAGAYYTLK